MRTQRNMSRLYNAKYNVEPIGFKQACSRQNRTKSTNEAQYSHTKGTDTVLLIYARR